MSSTLLERFDEYESLYDTKVMQRLPIIIKSNIRNFNKFSKKLEKPFCADLLNLIKDTMLQTIVDIDGAVFGYTQNGEISIVIKNDLDSPSFYGNKVQSISSIISSLMTSNFMKNYLSAEEQIDIYGEAIFETKTFATPNINETVNYIIWRQKTCLFNAVSVASEYELLKIYKREIVNSMLLDKSIEEKVDILNKEANIVFNDYPLAFYRGSAVYKTNKVIKKNEENITRKKWTTDSELVDFLDNRDFVTNIIINGCDVFDIERDVVEIR